MAATNKLHHTIPVTMSKEDREYMDGIIQQKAATLKAPARPNTLMTATITIALVLLSLWGGFKLLGAMSGAIDDKAYAEKYEKYVEVYGDLEIEGSFKHETRLRDYYEYPATMGRSEFHVFSAEDILYKGTTYPSASIYCELVDEESPKVRVLFLKLPSGDKIEVL